MNPRASSRCALAASLLTLAACGSEPDPQERVAARVEAPADEPARALRGATLPPEGQFVIEASPGGLRVLANRVPRIELLRALERALGFELELGRLTEEQQAAPLTLTEVDVSLPVVLLAVLQGASFEVSFAADAARGGHLLSRVRIAGGEPAGSARGERRLERRAERRAGRRAFSDPSERRDQRRAERQSPDARAREAAESADEAARLIESDDPGERAGAAGRLALDQAGVERLGALIETDPDPRVRAAAAERLGDDESIAALQQLLRALHDRDSQVILAALDALEFAGDESVAGEIGFLRDHPDPAVREAAENAIDFLQ